MFTIFWFIQASSSQLAADDNDPAESKSSSQSGLKHATLHAMPQSLPSVTLANRVASLTRAPSVITVSWSEREEERTWGREVRGGDDGGDDDDDDGGGDGEGGDDDKHVTMVLVITMIITTTTHSPAL